MRRGVTLPELILVAWLFALVLLALARFAAAQGRLGAVVHDRVRAADVVRTADLILTAELRYAADADIHALTADSVRLRAFRGAGVVCAAAAGEVWVRYRGVRRPDPDKDSVLVVTAGHTDGLAHALRSAAADATCGDGYRLALDPAPHAGVGLVLVFETGAYHFADRALRYRRGRGGRQPVTETLLDGPRFEPGPGRLTLRLPLDPDSLPRLPDPTAAAVVRLLNRAPQ